MWRKQWIGTVVALALLLPHHYSSSDSSSDACGALVDATFARDVKAFRRIVEETSAEALNLVCEDSHTALTRVVDASHSHTLEMLRILVSAGVDIDAQNGYRDTALSLARAQVMEEAQKFLEEKTVKREDWTQEYFSWWIYAHTGLLRWYVTSGTIVGMEVSEFQEAFPEVPDAEAQRIIDLLQSAYDHDEQVRQEL